MYKLITRDVVVDVLETVKYVRWLKKSKRFVLTDRTSAHGVYGSDNKTVYVLEGSNCPQVLPNTVVKLIQITESEFTRLKSLLYGKVTVDADIVLLNKAKDEKLQELSKNCKDAIEAGVSVMFSDNKSHEFRLTVEDQLNLWAIEKEIQAGSLAVLYHETGKACRMYRASDIIKLIQAADLHKKHHTTYYNILKHCINNMYSKEEVERVYYGIPLEDLPMSDDVQNLVKEQHIV